MAWNPFKKHAHRTKCVAVHHEELAPNVMVGGGIVTHALMRCDECGSVASHTFRGRFTIDQVNGVSEKAVAEALIEASKTKP